MELKIIEYNVTPNANERDSFSVLLIDDVLSMNKQNIDDENKVLAVKRTLEENKEDIIRISSKGLDNYKGGRQQFFEIKFVSNGEIYRFFGNTPIQETADFYNKIVTEIKNIVLK